MNADSYSEEFTVTACECDAQDRMTLGAILRRVQQIGADQCAGLGLTDAVHARTHSAFLLAKVALEQRAPLRAGQRAVITTMPAAARRAVYNRCTTLCAPDGTVLCALDSRWVLVDTQTRRILRHPPEGLPMPFEKAPAFELDLSLPKAQMRPVGTEAASYTRCDRNRHLNNTRYADIVCDRMPMEPMLACRPARLVISYHSEIPMGAEFTLLRGQADGGAWCFRGENAEGKLHFEAALALSRDGDGEGV